MPISRNAMTKHPLVEAYLADLDRALRGTDPRERAETLAAIAEHIDDALAGDTDSASVRRVLSDLGPVEAIAATTEPAAAPGGQGARWLPPVTLVMAGAGLALLVVNPFLAIPLALASLVIAVVLLRTDRRSRAVSWAAAAVAGATLLGALALALLLLSVGQDDDPVPSPVESATMERQP